MAFCLVNSSSASSACTLQFSAVLHSTCYSIRPDFTKKFNCTVSHPLDNLFPYLVVRNMFWLYEHKTERQVKTDKTKVLALTKIERCLRTDHNFVSHMTHVTLVIRPTGHTKIQWLHVQYVNAGWYTNKLSCVAYWWGRFFFSQKVIPRRF